MLEVHNLAKTYPAVGDEPIRAISGVSFEVARGELLAIFGPSGSGKTTLLKVLARVLRPTAGTVLVDGRDVASLEGRALNRYRLEKLGLVLQSTRLTPGLTVVQNASMRLMEQGARWPAAREQVLPLLERLELTRRLKHLPGQLSVGEKQRVAIAMALSTRPTLVLADEPTGSLDRRRGGLVLKLLAELCRERDVATVITTHDQHAISVADRSCELRDGRLVEHITDVGPDASAD